jgi:uncharacterized repeat protein (TIGR01451 family)/fimbrial isopeptide formation D2 family protein
VRLPPPSPPSLAPPPGSTAPVAPDLRGRSGALCAARWAALLLGLLALVRPLAAQDLPNPPPNFQVIPAGSLVIPMDNALQNEGALFNLRAYGLASHLLNNDIPLKWAIRTGKAKDGVDFTAMAARIAPDVQPAASVSFSGGPIIIHAAYAAQARARITSWNAAAPTRRVRVFELTQPVTVDVRYDLTFKPRPFVNTTNAAVATGVLDVAGIPYTVGGNAAILGDACFTILLEPHNTTTTAISEIRTFLQSGGNFYAQCASVMAFENQATFGRFLTSGGTTGLTVSNTGNTDTYLQPDLAFSQFIGNITFAPGGSEEDWRLSTGASFQSHAHPHTRANGTYTAATQPYSAMVGKIRSGLGGMVFYLGGHDNRGTTLGELNLQRMMLNAVLTPAERPTICNILVPVPDVTIEKASTSTFYVDSLATYTLTARNIGNGGTVSTLTVTDELPDGLTYVSSAGTGWTFSVSGQTVTAEYTATLAPGAATSFTLTVRAGEAALGTITNQAQIATGGEVNTQNNTATHVATVYGKPRIQLTKVVMPDDPPSPGTLLSYTIGFTNIGNAAATDLITVDPIPSGLLFRVGSGQVTLPSGVTAAVEYSRDGGGTWTYQPTDMGCGAPSGFDACLTHIRWRLLAPLGSTAPSNTGHVLFEALVR